MNFEQLKYIVEVAKTGSFTKAAVQSHVTLSAISQSVSLLENELSLTLFTRSRGLGAIPTAEGHLIIKKANDILIQVEELKKEAQMYNNTLSGELRIATIPGPMHGLIHTITQFKEMHPHVNIKIYEKGHKQILKDLENDKIDIGFIAFSENTSQRTPTFLFNKMLNVKIVVGVNKNSPLVLEKKIKPEQIANQTLVLYDDEYIRDSVDNLFSKHAKVNILFISNNIQAIQNAIRQNLAITIGLTYSFEDPILHYQNEIVFIELDVPNFSPLFYGWVRSHDKRPSNILKRFMNNMQL
ncbi:DNA-binding transcriptional LysR family regulator [Croceifilum oryzae]|uniref:DNA-binding transcriptional LysR family regulator n=1 Tax=Croceifilum oryzae TaxID=1553429 RepID=A0AAJ1THD8_9BACL|nr:LysR family transcriptional regulator [Croceifilum oryzae]MDQ0418908.1 DNA-binding transcriptional LysR family regulator [Croceifilum oryzae]